MKPFLLRTGVLLVVFAAGLLLPDPCRAPAEIYVEDFKSFLYRDDNLSTALWDTASGEIRLPPFQPVTLQTVPGGDLRGLSVSGTLAAAADASQTVKLFDVADATAVVLVGSYTTGTAPVDVFVRGSLAYVAATTGGLRVLDVSNPSSPVEIGAYGTANARGLTVEGGYAYVADYPAGVVIIDVSDPTAPAGEGAYATTGFCSGVAVTGDFAYAAAGVSGLVVLDISDPAAPDSVGVYAAASIAQHVAVDGNRAYVADGQNGLVVLDISDRLSPVLLFNADTADFARHVDLSGPFVLVSDVNSGVLLFDATDPTQVKLNSALGASGLSFAANIDGPFAFIADGTAGFTTASFGAEIEPVAGGLTALPDSAIAVTVAGDIAYVAGGASGLRLIDISGLPSSSEIGFHNTPGHASGVDVSGLYAYVSDGAAGLRIVDISDPSMPVLAASLGTPGKATGVTVSGDYCYIADGAAGLQVVEIVNPQVPSLVGGYNTTGYAAVIESHGTTVYVADTGPGTSGLRVLDTSSPIAPQKIGDLPLADELVAMVLHGQYVFALTGAPSVVTIDVSDPALPAVAGVESLLVSASGITVSGGRVYVGGDSGLAVLDATDPSMLSPVGAWPVCSEGRDVVVRGQYALLADGFSGFLPVQVLNYTMDITANIAQSLSIHNSADDIVSARLFAVQEDSIQWELSANGGANWDVVSPDNHWAALTVPGDDLRWRSTHVPLAAGLNPACSSLEIAWLGAAAAIDSILDVPDDTGGWVRLFITRSGYDVPAPIPLQITQYIIHRRVDEPVLLEQIQTGGRNLDPAEPIVLPGGEKISSPYTGSGPVTVRGDRWFVPGRATAGFPPGTWEIVGFVPALQQDSYISLAPTLTDSLDESSYTVYVVSAHTASPSEYFVSAPDSGYSIDNSIDRTPPDSPGCFTAWHIPEVGNKLTWCSNTEPDFLHYRVYRDTLPGFTASASNRVYQLFDTTWTDSQPATSPFYYQVTAVDVQFNESAASEVLVATGAGAVRVSRFALFQNYPNPFNRTTRIRFDLPIGGAAVKIEIYDAAGKRVRTLTSGFRRGGGSSVLWDGRDGAGTEVASGIYLCRMSAPGFFDTLKMTVLR